MAVGSRTVIVFEPSLARKIVEPLWVCASCRGKIADRDSSDHGARVRVDHDEVLIAGAEPGRNDCCYPRARTFRPA